MAVIVRKLLVLVAALFALVTPLCTAFLAPRHQLVASASATALAAASSETTTATMTEVQVGDTLPDVTMKELVTGADKPVEVQLADLVKDKKVAIFGVPGAFTPGCSKSHLPSFMTAQDELKAKGVDLTICVATNDAYVMEVSTIHAWMVLRALACRR